jgi:hypothetical protein
MYIYKSVKNRYDEFIRREVIGFLYFLLGLLTCEVGTDTLYRNVSKQLLHDAA